MRWSACCLATVSVRRPSIPSPSPNTSRSFFFVTGDEYFLKGISRQRSCRHHRVGGAREAAIRSGGRCAKLALFGGVEELRFRRSCARAASLLEVDVEQLSAQGWAQAASTRCTMSMFHGR
jgi:hypothetical protein